MGLRAAAGLDGSLGSPRGAGATPPARPQDGHPPERLPDDPGPAAADDRPELRRGGHPQPEPLLAGLGAAHQQRRPDHARVRLRLGRRRLEDPGRPDHQRVEPARRAALARPAADGPQQHRAHHRPAAGDEPARDPRGQEALSEARRHRVADGGVEARGLARHRQEELRTPARRPRAELRLPARHVRARHGRGGRPGAGVCLPDHRMGEGGRRDPRAGQADAERRPTSATRRARPPRAAPTASRSSTRSTA